MRRLLLLATALVIVFSGLRAQTEPAKFVVHEWGVTTFENGSYKPTCEEVLPPFVLTPNTPEPVAPPRGPTRGKPILYFYNVPCTLDVTVRFTDGETTCWYPSAERTERSITWRNVRLTEEATGDLQAVDADSDWAWWDTARDAGALYATVSGQCERYLFYEGTQSRPAFVSAELEDGSLTLTNNDERAVYDLMVFNRNGNRVFIHFTESLASGAELTVDPSRMVVPADAAGQLETLRETMVESLVDAGLYEAEAGAMADVWRTDFFETDGLRIIYRLSQDLYDEMLPLELSREADEIVRVMLVKDELTE